MAGKFEYSTLAHRYTARFQIVTYVGTQVNFWILANVFLVIISKLQSQIFARTYKVGFEDLSHFSFAFKKQFGYAPSAVIRA